MSTDELHHIAVNYLNIARERPSGEVTPMLWRTVQDEFALELTPDIRRLLYIARRVGGLSADIDDASLEQLGVETFVELLPMLKSLEGDLLIRQEDGRLLPSALVPDEEKL